jgi:hypothetical protein
MESEKERLANRLLDALAFDGRIRGRYDRMALGRDSADETERAAYERLAAVVESRRHIVTPELLRPHVVARYVAQFSEEELRQLIAFYESPLGQKFVRTWSDDATSIRRVMRAAVGERQAQHCGTEEPPPPWLRDRSDE